MTPLNVSEIFYSLQGESSYSGYPCVFIRLSGCNLRCEYCDSQYSWETGTPMSITEIINSLSMYPCNLVELTGGEPLLQEESIALMSALHAEGYLILLETNGAVPINEVPDYVVKIVDVKCPGSGHGDSFLLTNLQFLHNRDELKFVLTDRKDLDFAMTFIDRHEISCGKIWLSPVDGKLLATELAGWMLEAGVKAQLQLQLHKQLQIP